MSDEILRVQASALTHMFSKLIRSILTLSVDDLTMDLPVAQMRVCSILRDGPRSMSGLSRELGISLSAITQIADRMVRGGMVERVQEVDDRRVKSLQLTPHGSEVMRMRNERRTQRAMRVLEHLSSESRTNVLDSLNILLSASMQATQESSDVIRAIEWGDYC